MKLIDAEALEESIYREKERVQYTQPFIQASLILLEKLIKNAPTTEAKPVVHAHWVNYNNMFPCQCSNCNGFALSFDIGNYQKEIKSDFCPHCGAQMDESISCSHEDDKPFSQARENGVKIPVISMEDVPKIAKEMEK